MAKTIWVEVIEDGREVPASLHLGLTGVTVVPGILDMSSVPKPIEYPWKNFLTFSIEGPEQLQTRVTATRLLTIGIFAFAKKKSSGESFLFAEMVDGSNLIMKFVGKSEPEVKALFAPYRGQLPR